MRLRALQTSSAGALLGQTIAAVLVSTMLLKRNCHVCWGGKGCYRNMRGRAVWVHGLQCSPCLLRAVGRAFLHRMRAVTIVTMCERVLRCWLKILIFSGISDIYLQLIR